MLEIGLAQSLGDWNELDGHLRRLAAPELDQEDPTVIRTSQVSVQRERAVNDVTEPLCPDFAHGTLSLALIQLTRPYIVNG